MSEREVILNERPCDPRRMQAVLADWGLDEATIARMLSEQQEKEARLRKARMTPSEKRGGSLTVSDMRGH